MSRTSMRALLGSTKGDMNRGRILRAARSLRARRSRPIAAVDFKHEIIDALTDLMHLARHIGARPHVLTRIAEDHVRVETRANDARCAACNRIHAKGEIDAEEK